MKKVIKNISRILCSLLLVFSIFSVINVLASEVIFQITKIEVKEKSDKVTVNDVSLSGGSITNDIVFTDKNDYITYNITIKNNTEDDYKIKSISDDNTSTYLKYTYDDLSNVKVESGKEKTFNMTITYIQETTDLTITDKAVSLTLTYEKEDGTTGTETITNPDNNATSNNGEVKGASGIITNPKTGDNITLYIILGLISVAGLVITSVSKKHLSKSLMVVAVVSSILLPLGVKADSDKFQISFTTNKIQNSYSELIPGIDFNLVVAKLSSENNHLEKICEIYDDETYCGIYDTNYTEDDDEYYYSNDTVISIKNASLNQFKKVEDNLNESNIVSSDNSTAPVYIWIDNNIVYFYSHAEKIYLNPDSSNLFANYLALENIELNSFDTSNVTNMSGMFASSVGLQSLDLSSFDTSNVTNMSYMFSEVQIEDLDLNSFDTSNVVNMSGMFLGSKIENLNLSGLDASNVKDATYMFDNLFSGNYVRNVNMASFIFPKDATYMFAGSNINYLNLNNVNTSNTTIMTRMFQQSLMTTLDISSFDLTNVEDAKLMFYAMDNLTTIYATEDTVFSGLNIPITTSLFANDNNLVGGKGSKITNNVSDNSFEYAHIDGGPANPGYFTLKQN